MEGTFDFSFLPNEWVKTPFGDRGIVEMVAVDQSLTPCYYVKRDRNSQWFKSTDLTAAKRTSEPDSGSSFDPKPPLTKP